MEAASLDMEVVRERERLLNFLKKYDLQHYYSKFLQKGVHRLGHLKAVLADEASLDEIGLSRIERMRLRKKVKENVAWKGRVMKKLTGKDRQFDATIPEAGVPKSSDAGKEGRRSATIIAKEDINRVRKIGEGAHGAVHEGTWSDIHGTVAVAVKTLYGKQELDEFIKEANSMTTLHHKHIIQLFGIVLSTPLMLVEELAPFGSLLGYLKKEGEHVTLPLFHTYACQIADAMGYLETRRLVHRDLAIRNILLAKVDSVKLSDFGMARLLDDNCEVYNLSNLATKIPIAWTAPEAMLHAQFSSASDVWSYGVSLWEIYSLGRLPWKGLKPLEIRDLIIEGQRLGRPVRCPDDMFDLMLACWQHNPQKRPSFADILRRVEMLPPRQVRAVNAHILGDDPSALSFKSGDLIYIIDKPSLEWFNGMKMDGAVGHFRSDFVSELITPLDDIRAKVASGLTSVSDLSIGSPTHVDHMIHYYHDGSKWVSENAQDIHDLTPPASPTHRSSRSTSDPSVKPLPFTVIDARSPSPKDPLQGSTPKSPLLINTAAKKPAPAKPHPYVAPMSTLISLAGSSLHKPHPPNLHQQVGRTESAPSASMRSSLPPLVTSEYYHLGDVTDSNGIVSTPEGGDQYVSMARTSVVSPAHHHDKMLAQQDKVAGERATNPELSEAYVQMQSWSVIQEEERDAGQTNRNSGPGQTNRNSSPGQTSRKSSPGQKGRSFSVCTTEADSLQRQRSVSDTKHGGRPYSDILGLHDMPPVAVGEPRPSYESLRPRSAGTGIGQQREDLGYTTPSSFGGPSSSSSSPSARYYKPRSISTSHYQVPRPVGEDATPTTPQSILDASNPAPSDANLPEPLVPDLSPFSSPSKSQQKKLDLAPYLVELMIKGDDVAVFTGGGSKDRETAAGAGQSPHSSVGVAHHPGAGQSLRGSVGGTDSPPVPPRNPRSGRRSLLSDSTVEATESDYQPLIPETLLDISGSDYVTVNPTAALVSDSGRGVSTAHVGRGVNAVPSGRGVNAIPGGSGQRVNAGIGQRVNVGSGQGGAKGTNGNGLAVKGSGQGVNATNNSTQVVKVGRQGSTGFKMPDLQIRDKDDILEELLSDEEFSGCELEICKFALQQCDYDLELAREEVRVQNLLSMLLPHIREEDCRRALVHCQQKTNRAAAWLIQRSDQIDRRAQ